MTEDVTYRSLGEPFKTGNKIYFSPCLTLEFHNRCGGSKVGESLLVLACSIIGMCGPNDKYCFQLVIFISICTFQMMSLWPFRTLLLRSQSPIQCPSIPATALYHFGSGKQMTDVLGASNKLTA